MKGEIMANVTIFGAGNMRTSIDEVLTAGDATVDHIRSADPPGPVMVTLSSWRFTTRS
jgi:hypothetical protein